MADLIDRISGESFPDRPKINLHYFIGLWRLYVEGLWTRSEIAAALDLQGDEATQATALADNIDAEVGFADQIRQVLLVEAVGMALENNEDPLYHTAGAVNKALVISHLNL